MALLKKLMSGSLGITYSEEDLGVLLIYGSPTDIAKMPADANLHKSLMVFSNNILLVNEEQVSNIT